jgi:Sulfotransferase domain
MAEPIRVAMWSGPRNISTAMMRSFENRPDTSVIDEPFYAAFLKATGIDHPMREESMASQPTDPRAVVKQILGPVPGGRPIWYQKHMTHHMVDGFPQDWTSGMRNAFLIRAPEDVLVSYVQKREAVTLDDIGFVSQAALFDREAQRLGRAPPVMHGEDVLADPRGTLGALCAALDIAFDEAMLAWPAGRRASDGVWSEVWYASVERSTGFGPPRAPASRAQLPVRLQHIADAARPHYEKLLAFRLRAR